MAEDSDSNETDIKGLVTVLADLFRITILCDAKIQN